MASFCDKQSFNSSSFSLFENLCFGDLLNFVVNSLFMLMSVILILWRQCKISSNLDKVMPDISDPPVRYRGHNFRWLLHLTLIFINVIKVTEGVWSESYSENMLSRLHVILTPSFALFASTFAIIFYHKIEAWKCSVFLLLHLVYWPLALATRIYQVVSLYTIGFTLDNVRLICAKVDIVVYGALFLLEIGLLVSEVIFKNYNFIFADQLKSLFKEIKHFQKYLFKKSAKTCDNEEPIGLRFLHSSAMFLSKTSFSWIIPLLKLGFKRPLELTDLGNLPKVGYIDLVHRLLYLVLYPRH